MSLIGKSLALGFLAAILAAAQKPDCGLVPGWRQHGPTRTYEAENLFEYMNGNAEGYLLYRFVKMEGITCKAGEDTIVFDVSEMSDPEWAYGIFTANRDPRQPTEPIGMGGQILARKATFAKDRYYVELSAEPDKDHSATLRSFARAMAERISGRSEPPEVLKWFPAERRLNDLVRLVPESVLGLRVLQYGYVAEYEFGKAFLVAEKSSDAAAAVVAKLRARFSQPTPVQAGEEAFQATDRFLGRLCVFRKGRYIGGYANLKEDADPIALARGLAARIP